jgi:Arc-like DNA binding domain
MDERRQPSLAGGRPRGRKALNRPVVAFRVPEKLYELIKKSAEANCRKISEEVAWRVQKSFEFEGLFGNKRY